MQKEHVLIVEDDPVMRLFLSNFLCDSYQVVMSENGLDALTYLQNEDPPDIIIMDLSMPGMDGFELISTIRSSITLQAVPILVLSGSRQSEVRINVLSNGADDFMMKPFNPDELQIRVANLIARSSFLSNLKVQEKPSGSTSIATSPARI
mgnify:CR=1 FL=1